MANHYSEGQAPIMRLHVLSDLHIEFAPFMAPLTGADAVILAGDISTGVKGFKWALTTFTNCPVIYVLGNHEFYGHKLQKVFEQLKEMAKGTNIQILENGVFTRNSFRNVWRKLKRKSNECSHTR